MSGSFTGGDAPSGIEQISGAGYADAPDVSNVADTSAATEGVTPAQEAGQPEKFDPIAVTRRAIEQTKASGGVEDGAALGSVDGDVGKVPTEANPSAARQAAEGDKPKADADADDAKLPFGKHPRWKAVVAERNEARTKLAEVEPDAAAYRDVRSFMQTSGLEAQEVQQGFAIMAALKSDPAKALGMLQPYVDALQAFVGNKLPEDLQRKVDDGLVDDDTARETARLRNARAHETQVARATQDRTQADQQARDSAARAAVADNYVASKRQSDPSFALIEPLLGGQVQATIQEWRNAGKPISTPAHIQEVMDAAYSKVASTLRRAAPSATRSASIRPVPSSMSSTPAASVAPMPKSAIDVTRQALSRMRG